MDEVLATKLECILGVELLTKILSVGYDDLPIELTGRFLVNCGSFAFLQGTRRR